MNCRDISSPSCHPVNILNRLIGLLTKTQDGWQGGWIISLCCHWYLTKGEKNLIMSPQERNIKAIYRLNVILIQNSKDILHRNRRKKNKTTHEIHREAQKQSKTYTELPEVSQYAHLHSNKNTHVVQRVE